MITVFDRLDAIEEKVDGIEKKVDLIIASLQAREVLAHDLQMILITAMDFLKRVAATLKGGGHE